MTKIFCQIAKYKKQVESKINENLRWVRGEPES